jgi:hypothetical protein
MKSSIICNITPCSPVKVNRRFGVTYRLHPQVRYGGEVVCFTLVYCLASSLTLQVEAVYSSETCTEFNRTTRRYVSEDGTLYNTFCFQHEIGTEVTMPEMLLNRQDFSSVRLATQGMTNPQRLFIKTVILFLCDI